MARISRDLVVFLILRKRPALDHSFEDKQIVWYEVVEEEHAVLNSKDAQVTLKEKVKKKESLAAQVWKESTVKTLTT